MKKLIIILALLLSSTSIYTQDREQMRQMVSEYMKKIGIEDDQIQTSMMLVRKIMMEYVNEMEISKESSEKLKNYSDKQRQALKDLAKKLIKLRSENRSKSNFDKPNKRQGPARPDVGDPIFEKIIEYLNSGVDVVIGSRYLNGVSVVNWPIARIFLSYIAQIYVRLITGMPINDPTSGFVAYSKAVSYTHLTLPTNREV